jgi:two-component system, cell cycle sensor histidine kinase and response regulator CckA
MNDEPQPHIARESELETSPVMGDRVRRRSSWGMMVIFGAATIAVAASAGFLLFRLNATGMSPAWQAVIAISLPGTVFLAALIQVVRMRQAEGEVLEVILGAYESLRAPRVIVGPEGKVVYANSAFTRMFTPGDRSPLEAMQAQLKDNPEGAEELARLQQLAADGTPGQAEIQIPNPSGRLEWRSIEATPLRGFPKYAVLRIEDTTSRREMEQIIREEQEKLVDFLENAPVGFYSVDGNGRFIFVNHTLAEWLGTTPEQIISGRQHLHEFIVDGRSDGAAPFDPFGSDGSQRAGEVAMRGIHGRTYQAHISQSVVPSERGGLRTRSVVRDLTPEREMEEALRQSEQKFQRLFEDAPVGIALLDLDGRINQCNRGFRRQFVARSEADVVGRDLAGLVSTEARGELLSSLGKVVAGDELDAPFDVTPESNSEWVVALYLNRVEDQAGRVIGVIAHCLDTTDQRKLEVQFAQSQKMQAVGQLAGGIAHDFNNLLTAMIGFCDLLLLRHKAGEQSFADIMQIKQNANRAANLVRQLLAFSRQQTLKSKVLNVTDVLAELAHLLRRLVGENIELKMVHGRDLGPVRCDQGQLEQVIINLAVNARDAMSGGGKVTIQTKNVSQGAPERRGHEMLDPGDYVLIEVIDEGCGIPKENQGRIFEPFFSTKEVGSGTGLGLSTVYGIVKQTGGYIFVDSEPDKGSRFYVFLPRHTSQDAGDTQEEEEQEKEQSPDLTGVGTVLLVEDEDAVRVFSARALRNKGYTVLEAKSGEAAIGVLDGEGGEIDLLITDVVMPEMDGPRLIREVRERRPDIKVICISGYAEDAFRKKLDQSADIHFLPKPFSLNQLAGTVKKVMATGG